MIFGIAMAEPISEVEIRGNSFLDDTEIRKELNFASDTTPDSSHIDKKLNSLLDKYYQNGYLNSEIKWTRREDTLIVEIEEGEPAIVDTIIFSGNNYFTSKSLHNLFDLKTGDRFNREILSADIQNLLERYENQGFPYCQISVSDIQQEDNRLSITMEIDEGVRARIEEIVVRGNSITKENVVERELRIRENEFFSQRKLEQGRRYLERTGYFREVFPIALRHGRLKSDAILVVTVEEAKTNRMNGVVGYVPETDTGNGYFTGLLDFSFKNLMGTGRKANVKWQRQDPHSSFLRFSYTEPWILGFPISAGVHLEQTIQDSTYTKRMASLFIETPITDNMTGSVTLSQEEIIPGNRENNFVQNSKKQDVRFGAEYDTRNSFLNPTSGSYYNLWIGYGKRNYRDDDRDSREASVSLNSEHIFPTFNRQAISISLNGAFTSSEEDTIPIHERFPLGGASSLRGYKEDQFRGSHIAWTNLEYRFLLTRLSRFFLFFDSGYYYYKNWNPVTSKLESIDDVKIGIGLGLRIESRLGIIGVDYGLGEDLSLLNGKIHFGLTEEF